MEDRAVQFIVGDLALTMDVHAALCMTGTMDRAMTNAGALIMVGLGALILAGTGVLNMVDIAGIVNSGHYSNMYMHLLFSVFGAYLVFFIYSRSPIRRP